eukprot:5239963-Prymnesium_polylepis.1
MGRDPPSRVNLGHLESDASQDGGSILSSNTNPWVRANGRFFGCNPRQRASLLDALQCGRTPLEL